LNIANRGQGDAKFVLVTVDPDGYTLLSNENEYIGTIASDDYQTLNFDVIINNINPNLIISISYKDLDGKTYSDNVQVPLTAYTQERAIQIGLIKKNNVGLYIIIIIAFIIIWLIIRAIRKSIKKRKSLQRGE
jgi:hypothetical protein